MLYSGFPDGSVGKEFTCNAGDTGSVPGLGRSLGGGNGNPLQYSCLENPMDRGAWWATVHGVAKELDVTARMHYVLYSKALVFIHPICHGLHLLTPNSSP